MLRNSKSRATKEGLPHSITLEDIQIPSICPILGILLNFDNEKQADNSPSLDKIDPRMGYVPGNVWVISMRANRLKSNATPDEIFALSRALAAKIADGL